MLLVNEGILLSDPPAFCRRDISKPRNCKSASLHLGGLHLALSGGAPLQLSCWQGMVEVVVKPRGCVKSKTDEGKDPFARAARRAPGVAKAGIFPHTQLKPHEWNKKKNPS